MNLEDRKGLLMEATSLLSTAEKMMSLEQSLLSLRKRVEKIETQLPHHLDALNAMDDAMEHAEALKKCLALACQNLVSLMRS